jgi:hypothetical protein
MNRPDHSTLREWLNLSIGDMDGMLAREERARLEEHLASCAECRREREELMALESLLQSSALPVRADFRDQVLAALPSAGWEARAPRTWPFPVAVLFLFAAVSAAVLGAGSGAGAESSLLATLGAVAELCWSSVLAGAGLLDASWRGFGLVVADLIASPMSLAMFGVFVLCLDLLVISMVRRRRPAAQAVPGGARGEAGDRNGSR